MKKSKLKYLLLIAAFIGIAACSTVAYAGLCAGDDTVTHSPAVPCHSICHINHHHWISTDGLKELPEPLHAEKFLPVIEQFHAAPFIRPIFHPPAVL